jgi:hypothetical protein
MSDDKFTKDNIYANEQLKIYNTILTILEMQPDDGKKINKPDLDKKLEEISKLIDDVKKYYSAYVWQSACKANNKGMAIIRNVLKKHNNKLVYKYINLKIDNKDKSIQQYSIVSL